MKKNAIVVFSCLFLGVLVTGCLPGDVHEEPEPECTGFGYRSISLEEVKAYYQGETVRITDSVQWEGYVVSSDETSNLFGEIYLQDHPTDPTGGVVFLTDLLETHARVPFGSRVAVNLSGLYLGQSGGSYKLGGAFPSFGNVGVGRLPASLFQDHIRVSCETAVVPQPNTVTVDGLSQAMLNTYLTLEEVEFTGEEVGLPFADPGEETLRTLQDCQGNILRVRNSGYSDFHQDPLPSGNGTATGILSSHSNRFELLLMGPGDLRLEGDRCADSQVEAGSDRVLISEIADPDNQAQARFLELYNASDTLISLSGWELRRFTNANVEPGRPVSLSGLEMAGGETLVFSAYPEVFEATYGFPPDVVVPRNGPADSNGDDSIELVDPFGNVVDTFGQPGTDGSGTSHEFEDGRALRLPEVIRANPVFDPQEWIIHNDSGGNGTLEEPKNAPEDFSPGAHGTGAASG